MQEAWIMQRKEKKGSQTVSNNSTLKQQVLLLDVDGKTAQGCNDEISEAICGSHNYNLYKINASELKALQGTWWLSDAITNAALHIRSRQFPDVCGFQDALGERFKFNKTSPLFKLYTFLWTLGHCDKLWSP